MNDATDADAQEDYDADNAALRELLTRAAESPTVHRLTGPRSDAADDADDVHRARVGDSANRILGEDADLIQQLADYEANDHDDAGTT